MNAQHIRPTVVVGVDGSHSALRAVRWGAAEAGRRRARLRLVTAFGWEADQVVHPELVQRYRDILLDRARSRLREAAAAAEREVPDIELEQQLVVGHAIPVLGDEARRAQLVVIGDSGLGRIDGLLVGSVAVALAAHASCPVVVVRGTEQEPSATAALPVVVGVDESPTSEAAIAFAFEAAAARRVPLVAVHTWGGLVAEPALAPLLDWEAIEAERAAAPVREAGRVCREIPRRPGRATGHPRPSGAHPARAGRPRTTRRRRFPRSRRVLWPGPRIGQPCPAAPSPCPVAVVRPDTGERA